MNCPQLDAPINQSVWSPTMFPLFEEDSSSSSTGSLNTSTLSVKASESEDNDPDEEKLCAVCGDKANGYHFHVLTCEGCKGFFRRSISKGLQFSCPFTRTCPVTKAKRRQCQACRLQKCINVGMRKDMIMNEEALAMRRALRRRKKQERIQRREQGAAMGSLTEEQKDLIALLIDAHNKHVDSSLSKFKHYRPQMQIHILPNNNYTKPILSSCSIGSASPHMGLCQSNYPDLSSDLQQMKDSSTLSDVYNVLPHFADLSTYMIQQVIQFSKEIPAFRALTIEDQISLLKGSTMEVSNIQFNRDFNVETKMWQCGKIRFSIDDGAIAGFQQLYLEPLQKFHLSLRQLNLDQAEYVLLEALILFSPDRPGIMERKVIDEIQEKLAITLKCYIDDHHPLPEGRFLYPKLLSLLAELRTLNEENTRQILHIQDVSSDAMTPLMKEILC